MNKAVFLDRDGVLNRAIVKNGKPYAPRSLEDFILNPDMDQLIRLKNLGYRLIVVTNQPDVANGFITRQFVEALHARLRQAFPFDDILACLHGSKDGCECRKPKPGMLYRAREAFNICLANSYMIGDRWSDVMAGQAAGCATVFLDYGYKECAPEISPDYICRSLAAAIEWIETRDARLQPAAR
ncbi:MAG: D-glycero-alpha-D-manno-heptose-1,7-bisphosphate 7-phosphatase [Bdellovibrionales bacterium]